MTALFIGRFQPFHDGHVSVLKSLQLQGCSHVLIAIGSSQYQRTADNPLSLAERIACIAITLNKLGGQVPPYSICSIPDIHDDSAWVKHVDNIVSHLGQTYDVVYTGNEVVSKLFTAAGKKIHAVDRSIDIDGTAIRATIRQGNQAWRDHVDSRLHSLVESTINDTRTD